MSLWRAIMSKFHFGRQGYPERPAFVRDPIEAEEECAVDQRLQEAVSRHSEASAGAAAAARRSELRSYDALVVTRHLLDRMERDQNDP